VRTVPEDSIQEVAADDRKTEGGEMNQRDDFGREVSNEFYAIRGLIDRDICFAPVTAI
jgi:hypothetical protein